jgi:hypothetical protein
VPGNEEMISLVIGTLAGGLVLAKARRRPHHPDKIRLTGLRISGSRPSVSVADSRMAFKAGRNLVALGIASGEYSVLKKPKGVGAGRNS